MNYHRIRRIDQNRLLGRSLDRWSAENPWRTNDAMIRNAILLATQHGWEVQLSTGEYLVKSKGEIVQKKLVKDRPAVQGSRDPNMPGRILVTLNRQHASLPKVRNAPAETFYRYNERLRRVECMVTMMPNGLYVAWDTCGACATHIRACGCVAITPGRSVIHIWEEISGEAFAKPTYKDDRGKPLAAGFGSFLKGTPTPKTPLMKESSRPMLVKDKPQVEVDQSTRLGDFEGEAVKLAKDRKAALLASLGKPRLTKG
jgi:hypothetical protein